MNPTRRGSYGIIERDTLISLKISPICPVRELAHDIIFKILQQRPKNCDVMIVVHPLAMWQMFLVSTLLSAASTAASTTLLTQCTSHLHPVPTRLLNTSTNPSMSHSPEVPSSYQKVASDLIFTLTMQKSRSVTSPCCNAVLETIHVKLHGRSHSAPKVCEDDPPYGSHGHSSASLGPSGSCHAHTCLLYTSPSPRDA